jgi:protein arginine kinase activator
MLCQDCGQRVATVVYTEVSEGTRTVLHLCRHCVEQRGIQAPDLSNPLEERFDVRPSSDPGNGEPRPDPDDPLSCPACAWTWRQFRETGRLGCGECYTAFAEPLKGVLVKMHGSGDHLGKSYQAPPAAAGGEEEPAELRRRLDEAVAGEDFEEAARLRDRLRRMEDPVR